MKTALVLGGYGTFGSLVARELARLGVPVIVAGRDGARAEAFARELGPGHSGVALDATDVGACRALLGPGRVALNCAGPFSALGRALLEAALEAGSDVADISDDRAYATLVRELGPRFAERGLRVVTGCSALPGISGALALVARAAAPIQVTCGSVPPDSARVTLFIGNRNPKGTAAVTSAVSILGRPIVAPQGTLTGFRGGERVFLPPPFGARRVYEFESPDYDLFPSEVGVKSVRVKVGFESRLATLGFATLAALSSSWGERTARFLAAVGNSVPKFGHSGGVVQTELGWAHNGMMVRASLSSDRDGQRMAALPCALVGRALAAGEGVRLPGALTPWGVLGAPELVQAIAREGFALSVEKFP